MPQIVVTERRLREGHLGVNLRSCRKKKTWASMIIGLLLEKRASQARAKLGALHEQYYYEADIHHVDDDLQKSSRSQSCTSSVQSNATPAPDHEELVEEDDGDSNTLILAAAKSSTKTKLGLQLFSNPPDHDDDQLYSPSQAPFDYQELLKKFPPMPPFSHPAIVQTHPPTMKLHHPSTTATRSFHRPS